ncbi:MAG: TolC family protein [Bacteroidetes bacterium]|nr:TolC family protein [Bacteroidota bacterium]
MILSYPIYPYASLKKIVCYACFLFWVGHLYAQKDLSFYISTAKHNSPLIQDNQNQAAANQLEAQRLKAFYTKPQIGVTANYLFAPVISTTNGKTTFEPNSNGADKYWGYDLGATNGGQYQAFLNITQPLFNGGRYKAVNEQLTVNSQVNQNNIKLTEHDIEKVITDQYILCLQDGKQIAYANEAAQLLNVQKELLNKLVQNNIYKQSDLSLLNIEAQNIRLLQSTLQANYHRDLLDLNILSGIDDTSIVELRDVKLILGASSENSLFLEKYHLDSLSLKSAQKVFELRYKPQLNVFANGGLDAVYAPTIPNRFGLSAGLSFAFNFFDGNQRNISRSRTEVLLRTASAYKQNFLRQNNVRKANILAELQSYTERVSIAEQQLKEYDNLLNLYKKEILSGQVSTINYITTLRGRISTQRDYSLLAGQKDILINAYNYWNW